MPRTAHVLGAVLPSKRKRTGLRLKSTWVSHVFFPPLAAKATRSSGRSEHEAGAARGRLAHREKKILLPERLHFPRCWTSTACSGKPGTDQFRFSKRDRAKRGLSPVFEATRLLGRWTKLAQGHVDVRLGLLLRRGVGVRLQDFEPQISRYLRTKHGDTGTRRFKAGNCCAR